MSMVRCDACDWLFDDDKDGPCEESPVNGLLVCPSCYDNQYYSNHCQSCDKKTEKLIKGECESCRLK